MVFSFLNPIYSQQKDFFNISISPNYSWFNRTDSKAEYIKQVPQLGGEIGLGLNYKLNQKISLEPGFSILCLRNKSISTVEGGDVKFSDGELFSRLNFRLTVFYALAINERIQGAISLGTAATFGAKLKSEFINPIHEYHTDTFRNWNQLFESGIGLYYLTKGERKTYLGLRASFGARVITNKKVIHLNEQDNFVNRNNHCSLVLQYYLK
jgi:DNA-directed RNA polymerase subunit E'/Rpb7